MHRPRDEHLRDLAPLDDVPGVRHVGRHAEGGRERGIGVAEQEPHAARQGRRRVEHAEASSGVPFERLHHLRHARRLGSAQRKVRAAHLRQLSGDAGHGPGHVAHGDPAHRQLPRSQDRGLSCRDIEARLRAERGLEEGRRLHDHPGHPAPPDRRLDLALVADEGGRGREIGADRREDESTDAAAPRRIHERPLSQTVHGPDAVSGKSRTDRGGGGDDGGRAPASPPQGGDVSQVPLDDLDSVAAKEFLSWGPGTNESAHGALGRAQKAADLTAKEPGGSDDEDRAHPETSAWSLIPRVGLRAGGVPYVMIVGLFPGARQGLPAHAKASLEPSSGCR